MYANRTTKKLKTTSSGEKSQKTNSQQTRRTDWLTTKTKQKTRHTSVTFCKTAAWTNYHSATEKKQHPEARINHKMSTNGRFPGKEGLLGQLGPPRRKQNKRTIWLSQDPGWGEAAQQISARATSPQQTPNGKHQTSFTTNKHGRVRRGVAQRAPPHPKPSNTKNQKNKKRKG